MSACLHHHRAFTASQRSGVRQREPQLINCHRRAARPDARTQAAGLWDRLLETFSGFNNSGRASEDVVARNKLREASAELQQLLCDSDAPDLPRVNELLDELVAAEGQPISEMSLGGGPWVVRFTRGKPLLWNITYSTGRLLNSRNRAAQEFDPASRGAVNLVELNGLDNLIEAYGTYEPVDDNSVTPKTIRANIRSGRLIVGSLELPLPIFGTGEFDVMYVDDSLRVFRSNGRFAVQIRAGRLAAPQ